MAVQQTTLRQPDVVIAGPPASAADPRRLFRVLRTFIGQGTAAQPAESQNRWLAEVIDTWCAANFWDLDQLADLACSHSPRGKITLLRELEDIRLQKAIPPSPRLFQALAAAHTAVHHHGQGSSDAGDDSLRYATAITSEPVANRASWWFALYCQEAWAREAIALPLGWECPADLSNRLADYLRRQMVQSGRDPVSDGLTAMKAVFGSNQATLTRLNFWLIGLREMDRQELHSTIHPLLHVARNCGAAPNTVLELLTVLKQA